MGHDIHPNAKAPPSKIPIETIGGAFGAVLNLRDFDHMRAQVMVIVREYLWRLYKGQVSWHELALGAQFTYRTSSITAVGQLAQRMIDRNDEPLRLGQRFLMVYVYPPRNMDVTKVVSDNQCGETLDHVISSSWPYKPHVVYYLRHMYSPFITNIRIIDKQLADDVDVLFHNIEAVIAQRSTQQRNVNDFFSRLSVSKNDTDPERERVLYGKKRLPKSSLKMKA